jgi:dihydropyrimidinase
MTTLIRGGTVVNADRAFRADVCDGDKIAAVGENLVCRRRHRDRRGRPVRDAGRDRPHTHMNLPFMGTVTQDDFYTGTAAGLAGGTTTIMDFVIPAQAVADRGLSPVARVGGQGGRRLYLPRGDHLVERAGTRDMGTLVREHGVNSFKHFMAYKNAIMADDETLVKSFTRSLELGAPPCMRKTASWFSVAAGLLKGHDRAAGASAVAAAGSGGGSGQPRHRHRQCAEYAVYIVHVSCANRWKPSPAPVRWPARVRRGAGRPPGDRRQRLPER